MNVNTTSVTESTKAIKGSIDKSSSEEAGSESVGFFAQLAAMMKGGSKSEVTDSEASKSDGVTDTEATAAQLSETSAEVSSDLMDVDGLADGELNSELETSAENSDVKTSNKADGSEVEVEKTVAESEALLGRLDQANKALQSKDGNGLPLNESAARASVEPAQATDETTLEAVRSSAISQHGLPTAQSTEGEASAINEQVLSDELGQTSAHSANEAGSPSTEIAWQTHTASSQPTDATKAIAEDGSIKSSAKAVIAHGAAPSHVQAAQLASQQPVSTGQQAQPMSAGLGQVDASLPAMPIDTASTQKLEPAQLQAALAAGNSNLLGKLGKSSDNNTGIESSFAQHLSQAAGQNGLQGQLRTEQSAQAQPHLQLSRDMAGEQLAERVQMMMSKNLKNIDIRLDPPELGRMQIRMNMNGDNASVHFTVANQQARDIVEQAMPRLREMLAQQGMQLSDSSVHQQASGQQQSRYASAEHGGTGHGSSNQHFAGDENLEADVKLDLNVTSKRDGISYYA
ncbi:flagellar hook-length control protein FliK [Vibrio taketomensis]|nr:flagellar hook-length control protein FliK [Vibrio taketomensis]